MGVFWKIVLLVIGFSITYFLLYPLFILMILIVILYVVFAYIVPPIRRRMTPEGKRIKHKLLKGCMTNKYGEKEGKQIYKEFVDNLRKKGYY